MRVVKRVTYPDGSVSVIEADVMELSELVDEVEMRVVEKLLKKLEEEYELEIEINPRTGRGTARFRRRAKT